MTAYNKLNDFEARATMRAEVLREAADAWTAHQAEHMGKGTVQQIAAWLRARANQ